MGGAGQRGQVHFSFLRGDGACEEVGVDGGVDAVGAAGVGGVAVAVVSEEVAGGELGGEGDGPGVGGAGSRMVPTTRIGAAPSGLDALGVSGGLDGPVGAAQGGTRRGWCRSAGGGLEGGQGAFHVGREVRAGGRSRQLTAALAYIRLLYLPWSSRS